MSVFSCRKKGKNLSFDIQISIFYIFSLITYFYIYFYQKYILKIHLRKNYIFNIFICFFPSLIYQLVSMCAELVMRSTRCVIYSLCAITGAGEFSHTLAKTNPRFLRSNFYDYLNSKTYLKK